MKNIFLSAFLIGGLALSAQELTQDDAVRYASKELTGTARFRAMGGAFGALGGDLSAINVNPAGSVLFSNNYVSITASNYNNSNDSSYFGTATDECRSTLDLNQIGGVFVFNAANPDNDWRKFSIAFNYENTRDFDNDIYIAGTNTANSIGDYFLNYAQGFSADDLAYYYYEEWDFAGQQAHLGYKAYLFDPVNGSSGVYVSNVPEGSYYQQAYISSSGYNGKLAGNFATSYKDILFLGANLNAHFTDYVRTSVVNESNNNPEISDSESGTVTDMSFRNEVYTYGSGFSFNVGAIAKVSENFRLGVAYESPTWYRLNDELVQTVSSQLLESDGTTSYYHVDPYIVNVYPTYKLQTPSTLTGSAAVIFGKQGLLSVDVATKNYSNIEFRPKGDDVYQDLNEGINNSLSNALELRVGGEYKIKNWSLRAGYRFEESPYDDGEYYGDLTNYNCGLGYNFGLSRLDFAYSNIQRDYNQYLISSGMTDTARINSTQNNFTLTYSVNF